MTQPEHLVAGPASRLAATNARWRHSPNPEYRARVINGWRR